MSIDITKGKVREALRNPIDVLNSLKSKAYNESYHYERLYRNLYNSEFFLTAYKNIYANEGNMTKGADGKTIDGMSIKRIEKIIESLKDHSYKPNPARREYITKKNGKKRPLGIPSFDDKLVQEVVRMILESIYESTFSKSSHGFRPNRSCHTALSEIQVNFTGVKWFIEGDIKSFFDHIEHQTLINILRRRIKDEYFIALIWKFLKAGYLEDMTFHNTYSGTAQGSVISPVLSNIYLNEFDKYMERYAENFKKGKKRKINNEYGKLRKQLVKKQDSVYNAEDWENLSSKEKDVAVKDIRKIRNQLLNTAYSDPQDSTYRRLFYVRYADDWLCGLIGDKSDAEKIKVDIKEYLDKTLKLELSEEKTLITNAKSSARFLGYDILVADCENRKKDKNGNTRRFSNGKVRLYIPKEKWQGKLIEYGALKIKTIDNKEVFKPVHRPQLINNDDLEILIRYNAEIRGLYNYYCMANNVSVLNNFYYVMRYSMYKTFAAKYKTRIHKICNKYGHKLFGVKYQTAKGEKIMYLYNEGFQMNREGIKNVAVDNTPMLDKYKSQNRSSLIKKLMANECEWCGADNVRIEIHHVRKLKDLKEKKLWEQFMIARKRKTMAMCEACHDKLHAGKLD